MIFPWFVLGFIALAMDVLLRVRRFDRSTKRPREWTFDLGSQPANVQTFPLTPGVASVAIGSEPDFRLQDGDVIEIRPVFEMSDFPADVQKAADNPTVKAQLEKSRR